MEWLFYLALIILAIGVYNYLFGSEETIGQSGKVIGRIGEYSFKVIKSFRLTVPEDYDHDKQLAMFQKNYYELFKGISWDGLYGPHKVHRIDPRFTDKNFPQTQKNKLMPGKKYIMEIIEPCKGFGKYVEISTDVCLEFLKSKNAIFAGPQALSLLCQLKWDELPKDNDILSFDEEFVYLKSYLFPDLDSAVSSIRHGMNRHSCFEIRHHYQPLIFNWWTVSAQKNSTDICTRSDYFLLIREE